MKEILTIIFLTCFVSNILGQNVVNEEELSQIEDWYLIEYLDSTIMNKQIYKYSGACASYAYKISVDRTKMDSINLIGYHETWKYRLDMIDETTYTMGGESQYWKIKLDDERLTIQEFFRDHDTIANVFAKRKDIPSLKEYFSQNILTGTYIKEQDNSTVKINQDFTITGLDSISSYNLILDFWEEGNGMDGMYLKTKTGSFEEYHWWFEDQKLNLRKIRAAYENETGWVDAELVGKTIVLKRIE